VLINLGVGVVGVGMVVVKLEGGQVGDVCHKVGIDSDDFRRVVVVRDQTPRNLVSLDGSDESGCIIVSHCRVVQRIHPGGRLDGKPGRTTTKDGGGHRLDDQVKLLAWDDASFGATRVQMVVRGWEKERERSKERVT
jgi:hypothetical protein